MAKRIIRTGTTADPTGDSLKNAFTKVNDNFTELYNALGLDADGLNLGAFEFNGSVMTTTDSSPIVIDQATSITSDLTVGGDIVPNTNLGGNLGSPTQQWKSLYVSTSTIYINNIPLSLDAEGNLIVNGDIVSGSVTTSTTAPELKTGALWFNTDEGKLYVNYNDTWVDANPTEIDPSAVRLNPDDNLELPGSLIFADGALIQNSGFLAGPGQNAVLGQHDNYTLIYTMDNGVGIQTYDSPNYFTWLFDPSGNLTLPAGGDILDSLGNSVLGGGGSTGNFTFDGDIIDNGSGAILRTNRGNLALGVNMEAPGVPNHFHVAFEDSNSSPSANDLYFGDDYNYLQLVNAAQGVFIGTNNRSGGGQKEWQFGTDGVLTLPNGSTIGDGESGTGVPITTSRGTILLGNVAECEGGGSHFHIMKGGQQGIDLFLGDDNNYVKLPNTGGVEISSSEIGNQHYWTFDTDGNLTIPGEIKTVAGVGNVTIEANNGTARIWNFNANGILGLPNNAELRPNGSGIDLRAGSSGYAQIQNSDAKQIIGVDDTSAYIKTNSFSSTEHGIPVNDQLGSYVGTGGPNALKIAKEFFTNADTTIKVGSTIVDSADANLTAVVTGPVTEINTNYWAIPIGSTSSGDFTGNIDITSDLSKNWEFDTDGVLTLPDTTTVYAGFINGGPDNHTAGISTYSGWNQIYVQDANIGVQTSADGDAYNTWTFSTDGTLITPAISSIQTDTSLNLLSPNVGLFTDNTWINMDDASNNITNTIQFVTNRQSGALKWEFGPDGRTKFPVATVPTHSTGASGDKLGMVAFDGDYIYYCKANYVSHTSSITIDGQGATPPFGGGIAGGLTSLPFSKASSSRTPQVGWTLYGITNDVGYVTLTITNVQDTGDYYILSFSITTMNVSSGFVWQLIDDTPQADIWVRSAWTSTNW